MLSVSFIVLRALSALSLLAFAPFVPPPQQAEPPASLELRVNRTIARGIYWLQLQQQKDGTWPGQEGAHPGGMTALACLTLLKAGVPRDTPALLGGLRVLKSVQWKSTYSAAVYLMLQEALEPQEHTHVGGHEAFDFLIANQRDGLWGYPADPLDMSNTQFALLGLRAGKHLGYAVPEKTLERCASALFAAEQTGGGFGYRRELEPTGGMSAATLGGFAVLAELGRGDELLEGLLRKKKNEIAATESWLVQHWDAARNPYGEHGWTNSFQFAWLWAVERYCGMTTKQRLGEHDWYREGAEWLVHEQHADGGFGRATEDSCFALLFLRKATVTSWENMGELWKKLDHEKQVEASAPRLAPANEVPRMTDWLLCGPFGDKRGSPLFNDPSGLHLDKLKPHERTRLEDRAFERVKLKSDGWSNLEEITGRGGDHIDWVLATELIWEPADKSASFSGWLWGQFEDGWKIWLDGKLVSSELRMQSSIDEVAQVKLELTPGAHVVIVLVQDEIGSSAFGARVTDNEGKAAAAGLKFVADPLIKDSKEPKDKGEKKR